MVLDSVLLCKLSRCHPECGVNTFGVVVVNRLMECCHQLTERLVSSGVAKLHFKLAIETLLESVLPRTPWCRHGELCTYEVYARTVVCRRILTALV